ncbi:MAG: stage III sporulation protein AB [Clostridia bacterium]|nr:stage III sporulation protein AB [Clostridia bacterium]
MYRYIAIAIAFLSCTLCGLQSASRLKQRAESLRRLLTSIRQLADGAILTKKPIAGLIEQQREGTYGEMFGAYAKGLKEGLTPKKAWERVGDFGLCKEAEAAVAGFLSELATAEGRQLSEASDRACRTIEELYEAASEESCKKGRVYRAVGVLSGAAIAILLI